MKPLLEEQLEARVAKVSIPGLEYDRGWYHIGKGRSKTRVKQGSLTTKIFKYLLIYRGQSVSLDELADHIPATNKQIAIRIGELSHSLEPTGVLKINSEGYHYFEKTYELEVGEKGVLKFEDIIFKDDFYHIRRRHITANSGLGRVLGYFLNHMRERISYEKILQISGWCGERCIKSNMEQLMRFVGNSSHYKISGYPESNTYRMAKKRRG